MSFLVFLFSISNAVVNSENTSKNHKRLRYIPGVAGDQPASGDLLHLRYHSQPQGSSPITGQCSAAAVVLFLCVVVDFFVALVLVDSLAIAIIAVLLLIKWLLKLYF